MVILGVDPGSQVCGFAAIELVKGSARGRAGLSSFSSDGRSINPLSLGILQVRGSDYQNRLVQLGKDFGTLLERHQPSHVAFENVFLGKNPDSAFKLGQARGLLLYLALQAGCRCFDYSTRSIKKSITGSGGADKFQVRSLLENQFNIHLSDSLLDCSDALAVAVHHSYQISSLSVTLKDQKPEDLERGPDLRKRKWVEI